MDSQQPSEQKAENLTPIPPEAGVSPPQNVLKDFLKTLIVPLVINKFFMMYFGLMYSNYPDEGYGYGFAATIVFLLANCGFFIWKYRNIEDP